MSIKTDFATKNEIRSAAERLGLSLNSFIVMVAKQAARAPKIILDNSAGLASQINEDILNENNIQTFSSKKDFFTHLDGLKAGK
ncbi:MAG: DUF1778 domain-containing protein [Candidatus Margulisbacteria bacterium]|jgi:uncharacterized protein (DUF1778 family)|nr:DUF1778 domain-containing protein [Candidatus Margulisiibacteriota bacterium]